MQTLPARNHPVLAASIVALFSSGPVGAQPATEAQLPQVNVVGTSPLPGIGIEKNKLPYEVQSVSAEAIYRAQSLNLTEFMSRNLSGVNVNEVQGSPFQADVTYRGFRASAILGSSQGLSVYLDGVRVNEPFGDVVNWDMLPEAAFANVTLVPGSNPVYGLNTLGGALAFTTKSGLTTTGTELQLSAGSFGRKRADLSYGSKSDEGWHRFIAATAFDENGWRDQSSGRLGNVFAKIGRTQGDSNWDLSLLMGRSNLLGNGLLPSSSYGTGDSLTSTPSAGMYEQNRRGVYTHPDRTENQLNMLSLNFQRMLDSRTELAATAYLRKSARQTVGGDAEREEGDPGVYENEAVLNYTHTRQTSYGSSINLTKLLDKHHLTLGASVDASRVRYGSSQKADCKLDASRAVLDDCDDPELPASGVSGKSYALGLYAADTWNIAAGTYLTAAARFNHARVSNTITKYDDAGIGTLKPKESFNYNSLNPSLGISHKLSSALTVFGNVGQSNRAPTVIELGCADPAEPCRLPTGLQADPYLKQVIARTIEAGMRWNMTNDSGISASAYRSENRDDILFRAIGATGQGYFSNFSRTRRQGLDLSGYTSVGQVALRASYSYLHASYQDHGLLFGGERDVGVKPGDRIAGLPAHTFKLHADWRAAPRLIIGANLMANSSLVTQGNEDGRVGAQTDETIAARSDVKGYALLNLHANYEVKKGLDYFFRINNVFDRRFETYGMMAMNMFGSSGQLLDADTSSTAPTVNRFVAPGAPRSFMVGLRYTF
jgi:outer membrane receptor protein involved in Fe transport